MNIPGMTFCPIETWDRLQSDMGFAFPRDATEDDSYLPLQVQYWDCAGEPHYFGGAMPTHAVFTVTPDPTQGKKAPCALIKVDGLPIFVSWKKGI